ETVVMATCKRTRSGATRILVDRNSLVNSKLHVRERRRDVRGPVSQHDGVILTSSGTVIPGHDLKVVDPETQSERGEGYIGEVWIAGPCVARSYWNSSEATDVVFGARLQNDNNGPVYLRTGDLGSILHDELYVLGRIKEMIKIRGKNHFSSDIEATVAA